MKLPIFINAHGDVEAYASVEEAENAIEPIDVENGEYIITDADGRILAARVVIEEFPVFLGTFKNQSSSSSDRRFA